MDLFNRPTKRGKEKSPSDAHCQCEKEMADHLLASQPFLKNNDINNDILVFGKAD
jgi:hypothetical protein